MTDKRLAELKEFLITEKKYGTIYKDLIELIETEQKRRVPSEDVQSAIYNLENLEFDMLPKDVQKKTFDLAITALRQMQGWIPVSDSPIETGNYLVIYEPKPDAWSHTGPEIALWDGNRWSCEWDCGEFGDYVTHWMPLTEPPKGEIK